MSSVNRWETCSNSFTRLVLTDLTLECDVKSLPRQAQHYNVTGLPVKQLNQDRSI